MADVKANLAGTVFKVAVAVGDRVEAGQEVVRLESMKMEIPIETPVAGTVSAVLVTEGAFVNDGDALLIVDPDA
jgi:acetyl-CoA carboxylase biotin carboxyl carrier protein